MNTRAQFQRTLFPGLKSVTMNAFSEKKQQYSEVGRWTNSTKAFEEFFTAAGVGLFIKTPETTAVQADAFTPGFSIRYDTNKFGLRIGFSEEAIEDMLINMAQDRGRDLGFSGRQTIEVLFADIWNNGFTTNIYDGVPLFSTAHPNVKGSGTQSNVLGGTVATPATVSVLAVRQALTQYRRFFDETGVRRIQVDPTMIVVPPEEEFNTGEIFKSSDRPDTANRATNVISGRLRIVVYDYLTDINNWFIGPTQNYNRIRGFMRKALEVMTYEDKDTATNWVQAKLRYSQGVDGWLGWLGTNPVG